MVLIQLVAMACSIGGLNPSGLWTDSQCFTISLFKVVRFYQKKKFFNLPLSCLIVKKIFRLSIGQCKAKFWLSKIFFGSPNETDKQKMNNAFHVAAIVKTPVFEMKYAFQ